MPLGADLPSLSASHPKEAMSNEHAEAFDRILAVLTECGAKLFSENGLETAFSDGEAEGPFAGGSIVAVLGYAGAAMKGSLVMQTSWDVARALTPEELGDGQTEDTLRDLMGELSNQLLGRLKNRLLPAGVVLSLATPTTACGSEVRLGGSTSGHTRWTGLVSDHGPILVRFDATFAPDFALGDLDAAPEEAPMTEGDLMFF